MPKWLGNRFGDNVPVVADSVTAAPAVYNMNDQYFLQSDSAWPVAVVTPVSYLLVGGGGGGGTDMAGGGGGGGFFHGSAPSGSFMIGTNYAVTIGAGGASGSKSSPYTAGGQGNDTSLQYSGGEYRAAGGGAGAGQPYTSPRPAGAGFAGGSGGGGSGGGDGPRVGGADDTYPSEPGTPAPLRGQATTPSDQGNDGGAGYQSGSGASGHYHGGGGGGAGAVGGNAAHESPGAGGNGAPAPPGLGGGTFAGGGGGAGGVYVPGGAGAPGGTGGGGAGAFNSGTPGTVNTGGGGGSAGHVGVADPAIPGAGGSGIIKLLYPNLYTISNPGGGLTMSTATPGSDKLTSITAGTGNISFS